MEDHLNFLITFENTIKYDHIYPRFAFSSSPHIFPNMSPPNFLSFRFYNSLSSVSAVDVFVGSGWSTGGQENLSVGTWFLHMIWWCVEKNSKSSAKRSWKTIRWLSKFMVLDQNLSCFREIHRLSPTHPLSSLSQMLPREAGSYRQALLCSTSLIRAYSPSVFLVPFMAIKELTSASLPRQDVCRYQAPNRRGLGT